MTSQDSDTSLEQAGQDRSISDGNDPFLGWLSSRTDMWHSSRPDFVGAEDGERRAAALREQVAQLDRDAGLRQESSRPAEGHQSAEGGALREALRRLEKQLEMAAVSREHCARAERSRPAEICTTLPGTPEGWGHASGPIAAAPQDQDTCDRGQAMLRREELGQASRESVVAPLQGEDVWSAGQEAAVKELQAKAAVEMARLVEVQARCEQRVLELTARREQVTLALQGVLERLDRRACAGETPEELARIQSQTSTLCASTRASSFLSGSLDHADADSPSIAGEGVGPDASRRHGRERQALACRGAPIGTSQLSHVAHPVEATSQQDAQPAAGARTWRAGSFQGRPPPGAVSLGDNEFDAVEDAPCPATAWHIAWNLCSSRLLV